MSTNPSNSPSVAPVATKSRKKSDGSVKSVKTEKAPRKSKVVIVDPVPNVIPEPTEPTEVKEEVPPTLVVADSVEEVKQSEVLQEEKVDDDESKDEKLSRKKKNYNNLLTEVEHLNALVEKYLVDHSDAKNDTSKLIKHLNKGLKKIRTQVLKLNKTKVVNQTGNSSKSGFQKPVRISEAVASFTGWDVAEPRARVDVTNYICDYIKQNKLQSPQDGRVILADEKLSQLLNYESERDGRLTYATIQKLLARHYSPVSPVSPVNT